MDGRATVHLICCVFAYQLGYSAAYGCAMLQPFWGGTRGYHFTGVLKRGVAALQWKAIPSAPLRFRAKVAATEKVCTTRCLRLGNFGYRQRKSAKHDGASVLPATKLWYCTYVCTIEIDHPRRSLLRQRGFLLYLGKGFAYCLSRNASCAAVAG